MMDLLLFMFVLLPTFRQVPAMTCTDNDTATLYETGEIKQDIQAIILNYHNQLRNTAASGKYPGADSNLPKASNLPVMVWDKDLASSAQAHANFCKFKHFDPANKNAAPDTPLPYGQNIFEGLGSNQASVKMNWTYAMENWKKESKVFKIYLVDDYKPEGPVTGHFTQMIWGTTNRIGCGFALGSTSDPRFDASTFPFTGYYTCNYLKRGNVHSIDPKVKIPIYKKGDPCSDCGSGKCDSTYTNLCSSS